MQKKNIYHIIGYVFLILFFFLGTLFYRQSFLAVLLLLICILPLISIGVTYFVSRHITCSVTANAAEVTLPNPVILSVHLSNPTWLPLLNCVLTFDYRNLYFPEGSTHNTLCLSAVPKRVSSYHLPFETKYPGMLHFSITAGQVTDLLHLKSFAIPVQISKDIPILPKKISLPPYQLPPTNEAAEEGDFARKFGVTSTEIQGVREYRPGDRLQHIHWKMSAKTDELLVREPQPVAERFLTLLPELSFGQLPETLETLYSLCLQLIEEKEIFYLTIFSYQQKTFRNILINNPESFQEAFLQLYFEPTYHGGALAREYYTNQNPSIEYVSIYGNSITYYYGKEPLK